MKLRVQSKKLTSQELITVLEKESAQGTKPLKDASKYGLALALMSDHQHQKARPILSKLVQQNPEQLHYLTAQALNEYIDKNTATALTLFEKAKHLFPNSRAVNLLHAQVLLHAGKPKKALVYLNKDLLNHSPTPKVYDLLSIAYGQVKNPVRGFQFRAEYFYSIGHTKDAIVQLEQAYKAAENNFYLSSQIENKISLLRDELKEPTLF